MKLPDFMSKYPPHSPAKPPGNKNELRLLRVRDGVRKIGNPPAMADEYHAPLDDPNTGRYLWVFFQNSIPYIQEIAPVAVPPLATGKAKHTNLTGGGNASSGWRIMGRSCRSLLPIYKRMLRSLYGPRTEKQLEDSVEVFRQLCFKVESFGWDEDVDKPARFLRRP